LRASYITRELNIPSKEPYISKIELNLSSKEPYIACKDPYIPEIELHIPSKEPCIVHTDYCNYTALLRAV